MDGIPLTFHNKPRRFVWIYRSAASEILGYVARFDANGKKVVVPYFNRGNDHYWKYGIAIEPRPLFGLEILAQADHNVPIFVVEGEKAAAALQSIGLVAISSQGGSCASDKTDWTRLEGYKHVYLMPDRDEPGEAYVRAVAAILACLKNPPNILVARLPNLPVGGDVVDWIAARIDSALLEWDGFKPVSESGIDVTALVGAFQKEVHACAEPIPAEWRLVSEADSDWPVPISLESATFPVWPNDIFFDSIQEFVTALSISTETPPELSALMVLAAISSAAQGKYRVQVKQDYFEPVNIWTCVALPPGSRKTAVQMAATAPLTAWEKLQRKTVEPEIKRATSDHATLSARIAHLRKDAGRASEDEFKQLKKEIAEAEAKLPEIPIAPQVWAQDITAENLGTIMADNNERMAILSDESGIFDILAGRYSGGIPNLDLFLQGHAGSPVKVNRGSRPPISMHSPSLTLGLSPQPEVIRGLTANPSFRGRGLLGRFLYALPCSNLGYRTWNVRSLLPDYRARYEGILTAILNHKMVSNEQGAQSAHILKITEDASQALHSFSLKIEGDMREGGIYDHMTDWAGKLPGAVVRISALLHITRHALDKPWTKGITIEDMNASLRMAEALSTHALAVFDLMGADTALDGARVVLRWIKRVGKPEFTFRDCHQAHKSRYRRAADLEPIIDVLMERHFIRPRSEKVAYRPSRYFEVNPSVLEKKNG